MKYEKGDLATFYFITDKRDSHIVGWTDEKVLAKSFLEFHNCKYYKLKEYTNTIDILYKITDENIHDEIRLINITIRKDNKKGYDYVVIPATEIQNIYVRDECQTFLSSKIDYAAINNILPYLKSKYVKALHDIYLLDIINHVINGKGSKFTNNVLFDELLVFIDGYADDFDI